MEVVKQLTGELLNTPRLTCKQSHKQNSLIRVVQARIREAKGELTAEIRVNTERVNQLTTLLRERKQYERDLNARQKDLVSVTSCRRHDTRFMMSKCIVSITNGTANYLHIWDETVKQLKSMVNPSIATLKQQSNGPSYSNSVIGTLALMGGLLHLVQRGGDWAVPQPAQAPPYCTKCNSPPINGQCTNLSYSMWHYNCIWSLKG